MKIYQDSRNLSACRQFCDRCGADVTQKKSAAVHVIGDADSQGNGAVTSEVDLCQPCRAALEAWVGSAPPTAKKTTTPDPRPIVRKH